MDETIFVSSIIDKLPPSWKDFKHNLKHGKDELSLIQLGSHLRIEESLRAQEDDKGKGKEIAGPSVNMVKEGGKNGNNKTKGKKRVFKNNNGSFGANKKPKLECWKCGKTGHFKKDCRSGKKHDNANASGSGKGSKDQSESQGQKSIRDLNSLIKHSVSLNSEAFYVQDDAIAWWIDSGATTHVCKDCFWFKTLVPVEDGSVLYMGDDHFAPVEGKGNVVLEFSSGKTITLFNVLYVPKLRKNLISGPVLNKLGYKQVCESDKYVLSKSGVFVGFGYHNNGMFMMNLNGVPNDFGSVFMSSSNVINSSLWHARLGHRLIQSVLLCSVLEGAACRFGFAFGSPSPTSSLSHSFIFTHTFSNLALMASIFESCWQYLITNFSDFQLACLGSFFLHESVFFLSGLPFVWIERAGWLSKYKIQAKNNTPAAQDKCIVRLLIYHFGVNLPVMIFSYPVFKYMGMRSSLPLPSWNIILTQIIFYFILEDFIFYWGHRILHTKWLYKHVHSVHHEYATPFGLTSEYAHPAEILFLGFATIVGPAITGPHLITLWLWMVLRVLETVEAHCGYHFPWSLSNFIPLYGGADFHDYHHRLLYTKSGNYSSTFTYMDRIFGSDVGYRKLKALKNSGFEDSYEQKQQ
ncbi:Methylsterol monooxygenase 2-2 [Lathyrus oleraceus]|uniref:Methylsterol monooxygenase 2-2 n=2 Tax=Pisum sativum TaxID=3888 RepID=A0A9D4YGG5_PEA|nr:Methylsterol monooxygenase 2-2 [Pisum sativum]